MPNNQSIQLLRKKGEPASSERNSLLEGQPLYDIDNNKLYIGNGAGANLINPTPQYPVTSVNGKTGEVKIKEVYNVNDENIVTFNYSTPGLTWNNTSYIASWNGHELCAINKDQFSPSNIGAVAKSGDTMTGPLYVQDNFGETARVVTTLDRMPYANIQLRTAVGIHYHPICTFEKSISEGDNSAGITIMGQIGGWEAYRKDNVHYTIGNRAEPTITGFHSNDLGSDKYHFELYQNASDANKYDLYLVCGDWTTIDIIVFGHYITLNNPYIAVNRPTTEQVALKDERVLITKQPKITLLSLIPDKTNLSRANLTVKVENVPESLWSHLRAEVCVFRRHDVKSRINGQKVQRVRYRWQRINKHEDIQQKGDIFIFKNQYFDARRHGGQGKFCIRLRYLLYQNINGVVRQYGAITFAQENFSVAYTKVQQDLQKPRIR